MALSMCRSTMAVASLRSEGFAGVVLGDIHLADVRAWYDERVKAAGLQHVEPIWGEPPAELVREFVETGGRAVITCMDLTQLDPSWLGRIVDEHFLGECEALRHLIVALSESERSGRGESKPTLRRRISSRVAVRLTQLDSMEQCERTFSSRPIGCSRRRTASVPARSLAPGRKPGP